MAKRTAEARRLEAFIGAQGYKTGEVEDDVGLIELAARMFGIPAVWDVKGMTEAVDALGKKERSRRAREFFGKGRASAPTTHSPGEDNIGEAIQAQRDRRLVPPEEVHDLLHKVVMAVINRGHASDLYEFPDVLAYFGAQLPEAD